MNKFGSFILTMATASLAQGQGPLSPTAPSKTGPVPALTLPPAPRLGQQVLASWGRTLSAGSYTTLDCKAFGNDYVIAGVVGKHGEGIDQISLKCTKLTADGRINTSPYPAVSFTATVGGSAGTSYKVDCPQNTVVVGITGTMLKEQVRGIRLRCQRLLNGLVNKAEFYVPLTSSPVGNDDAPQWGPNDCGSGRPARALKVGKDVFLTDIPFSDLVAPKIIAAVQLICEQPPYA